MREFNSIEEYYISGRGKVFVVISPEKIPISDIRGKEVKVSGMTYLCKGVEMFAIYRPDNCIKEKENFGILVEEDQ